MFAFIENIEWNPLHWALETRMRLAVFLLRLYAGAALLWVGYQQWHDPNFGPSLPSLLMGWAQQNPFFFYEDILRYIATPNAHIIAWLIPILQMAIGGLLLLGLFTRWSVLAMMFLTFNYFLATQHTSPAAAGVNIGFVAMGVILFFADAGHAYGLDELYRRIAMRFGWLKTTKRKRRKRLPPPKPKLKLVRSSREDREEREERPRRLEKPRPAASNKSGGGRSIENALGSTLRKLKERQQLQAVQKPLKRYEPDELDDDDDYDDEEDIYAYHGDDDDDD